MNSFNPLSDFFEEIYKKDYFKTTINIIYLKSIFLEHFMNFKDPSDQSNINKSRVVLIFLNDLLYKY